MRSKCWKRACHVRSGNGEDSQSGLKTGIGKRMATSIASSSSGKKTVEYKTLHYLLPMFLLLCLTTSLEENYQHFIEGEAESQRREITFSSGNGRNNYSKQIVTVSKVQNQTQT